MLVSSVPLHTHTHTQTQEYLWHCLSTVPHPHCDWTVFRFPYLPHAISQHMVLSNTCPTLLLAYWCWAGRCKDCGSDWSDWVKNYSVWSSVWGGGGGLIFSSLDWIDIPVTSSFTTQTHTVIGYWYLNKKNLPVATQMQIVNDCTISVQGLGWFASCQIIKVVFLLSAGKWHHLELPGNHGEGWPGEGMKYLYVSLSGSKFPGFSEIYGSWTQ